MLPIIIAVMAVVSVIAFLILAKLYRANLLAIVMIVAGLIAAAWDILVTLGHIQCGPLIFNPALLAEIVMFMLAFYIMGVVSVEENWRHTTLYVTLFYLSALAVYIYEIPMNMPFVFLDDYLWQIVAGWVIFSVLSWCGYVLGRRRCTMTIRLPSVNLEALTVYMWFIGLVLTLAYYAAIQYGLIVITCNHWIAYLLHPLTILTCVNVFVIANIIRYMVRDFIRVRRLAAYSPSRVPFQKKMEKYLLKHSSMAFKKR